jgi:hypothetical protein
MEKNTKPASDASTEHQAQLIVDQLRTDRRAAIESWVSDEVLDRVREILSERP